jgi:twitching motility protein PilT
MVLRLLKAARDAHASDLYIKSNHVPIGRIAGQLRDLKMPPIPAEACEQALIAILSDRHRKRFLETKDLDFCYDGGPELGRFRTSYLRHRGGVDGIFRLIPNRVPSLQELGLPDQVAKFTQYRQGIVIITGPKSSGKTTTLAAMVDLINSTRAEHIITIEDPIEFLHPCKKAHVNQREVGTHTESFHTALRAALREAPDVIMVGEMRDLETTSLAITAAETGHLVLATLHTPNAVRTIGRVLDVFPPKEQGQIRTMLSESLRGIVSQRLLPSADGRSLHLAIEILINTPAAGNLIREDKAFQLTSVMQTGKKLGMVLMDESLIRLAQEGKIAPEEAMQRADDPDFVQNSLMPQKKRR